MSDYISRADAIEAVCEWGTNEERKGNLTATMVSVKQCVADILFALPSAEQVTGKLKKPCDSLLTDDKDGSKEQKSKLNLISRAEAMSQCKNAENKLTDEAERKGLRLARFIVGELPSADAVEVVRCGECKYKRLYDDGDTKYYYCALEDRPNRNWSVDDTDYCSWGERNEII